MVQKHIIVSMIAPVAIAGILIMAILANQAYASSKSESSSSEKCKTTKNGNSQGEENCKTAQGENTEGGKVAQESSNTGKEVKESSNTGKEVKKSSNNGNAAQESSNNGKVAPVQPAITLTPIQAHVTTKSHMTATNEQLSKNGKLTNEEPPSTKGACIAFTIEKGKEVCLYNKKVAPTKECHRTSGGSLLCLPNERHALGLKAIGKPISTPPPNWRKLCKPLPASPAVPTGLRFLNPRYLGTEPVLQELCSHPAR